jgi:hypothetical protein
MDIVQGQIDYNVVKFGLTLDEKLSKICLRPLYKLCMINISYAVFECPPVKYDIIRFSH